MYTVNTARTTEPDPDQCVHRARFSTDWPAPGTAVITICGELDAANNQELADYLVRELAQARSLVLDLHEVEFFGTACFSVLHMLNVRCANSGAEWAFIPSRAVNRLLRICDPDSALPSYDSIGTAFANLRSSPRLLKLIPKSR